MPTKVDDLLKNIPDNTGVYLMKDDLGVVIYVGKAKSLKNRVKSYFNKEIYSPKISVMVPKISDIDFITTDNEAEALILEDTLIKKHKPKYNTLLKDDKKFPWIEITDENYPRILVTRSPSTRLKRGKSKYFGPYVRAGALYSTIDFLKQIFPLKQCRKPLYRDKPCINYHIHRCLAPCQQLVHPSEYKQVLKQVELFLSGKQSELLIKLEEMMKKASNELEFEKAAKYRDTIKSIKGIIDTQKIVSDDYSVEQDIFSFINDEINIAVILFKVREGKLIYKEAFDLIIDNLDTPEETFWSFLTTYYQTIQPEHIPKEIIVPWVNPEFELLANGISIKKGKKVKFVLPKAGKKLKLLQMAEQNAQIALSNFQQEAIRNLQNDWSQVGVEIQEKLKLARFPLRVECFDISHLAGTDTVASMVVFEEGKPKKSEYRKFKINSTEGSIDDFAAIKEVVARRYSRLLKDNKDLPDLIIVDGGKGQLSSAVKALKEVELFDQQIVSLAKRLEEVFIPGSSKSVIFDKESSVLYFFQQIRDEAHRFAITFQRSLRSKRMLKSELDKVKFIGKQRKARLLKHFGNVDNIFDATEDDLAEVEGVGKAFARAIYKELHK